MKKVLAILLTLTMCIGLAACSAGTDTNTDTDTVETTEPTTATKEDDSEETLTIGFSIATLEFPYYVTMKEAFEAACDAKGYEYIIVDSNNDSEKAINDCADMLSQGVDALVISSWYGATLTDVFESCTAKGVPVFLIDTGTADRNADFITDIGTNSYEAGRIGGLWTASYMRETEGKEEINLLNFLNATDISRQRVDGFVAGLEEGGLTVQVLNEYLSDSREGYMSNCEDALITFSEVDLIYGANALAGLGSFDACEAANRTEIKIVGFDAEDEEIQKIDGNTNYIASIMQLPASMAEETVQMIEDYIFHGASFEKTTDSDSGVYCVDGELMSGDIAK